MIPDPPAPLCVLPATECLEVLVPRGTVWMRALGALGSGVVVLVALWLAVMGLLGGVALAMDVHPLWLTLVACTFTLVALVPSLGLVATLQALARDGTVPVRAGRCGLSVRRERIAWEIVREVRADGDCVSIMLEDGEWMDVASELPQAAAWWLAASLGHIREHALHGSIDADGLAAIEQARQRSTGPTREVSPARDSTAGGEILPVLPAPAGC